MAASQPFPSNGESPETSSQYIAAGDSQANTLSFPSPTLDQSRLPNIPGFRLQRIIGSGGNGIVYEAVDEFDRVFALKMMHPAKRSEDRLERFRREAEAMAQVEHAHIAPFIYWGQHEGAPFFTMKFFRQGSLAQHLQAFQEDPRLAVGMVAKVARAVQFLHDQGKIHRDLKPHNILLDDQLEPHISDFGLVKEFAADSDLSITGMLIGTPPYMSPEQASGRIKRIGPRSDIWSLGVILYELLTGKRPFVAADVEKLLGQIQAASPKKPTEVKPDLDLALERIILKCLEKDPAARYSSAALLAEDLTRWINDETVPNRLDGRVRRVRRWLQRRPWLLLLAGLLVVAVAAGLMLRPRPGPTREHFQAEVRKELQQGKTVTLLGERGPPRLPFALRTPADRALIREREDGTYTVETAHPALIELMSDPGVDEYIYRVQVRQNSLGTSDRMGVYVGHRSFATSGGEVHYFLSLAYSDFVNRPFPGEKPGGVRDITYHYLYSPPGQPARLKPLALKGGNRPLTRPEGDRKNAWRTLEVKVTAKARELLLDGVSVLTIPYPIRQDQLDELQSYHGLAGELPIDFGARGGLGFFLAGGSASFKHAEIVPLPEKGP